MDEKRIHGYCALCVSRCGCISVVRDGMLSAVEPDPSHPTGRALCIKGRAAPELVYSPDRLLYPMKRTRAKGDPDAGWTRISWDEALATTARELRRIAAVGGPEAVAFAVTTPSGTAVSDSFVWINRLAHAFGSPNLVFNTENCNWHKDYAPALTFGSGIGMPDYGRTGCLLLWGFNPSTSWLAQATAVKQAQRRGAALVVVDPRKAGLANSADQWLRVRPGTDGVLALALAQVLIEHGWYDRDFVCEWTNGPFLVHERSGCLLSEADIRAGGSPQRCLIWDCAAGAPAVCAERPPNRAAGLGEPALFGHFVVEGRRGELHCRPAFDLYAQRCARHDPAAAEAVTGVPAAQISATAELLYTRSPVSYFTWTGTAQHANATQTTRAISLLYALCGALDAPGGNVLFSKAPLADFSGLGLLPAQQRAKCLGLDRRPLGPGTMGWTNAPDLFRAIAEHDPYPVRALLSFGADPLLTTPASPHAQQALERLEFHVHADLFLNPSAACADIVLPVSSAWERSALCAGFQISQAAESLVQLRPAAVEPCGEARSDEAIVFDLACRLGLGEHFFGGDREAALRARLAPAGLSPEQLREHPEGLRVPLRTRYRKYRRGGFATPSGRLEIYSTRLLEAGYAPLPEFDPGGAPAADAPYPLLLTCAKGVQYCHSQHHGLPALRRRMPEPLAELHPRTASARGIGPGDWMVIRTSVGQMRARARFNRELSPEVVCAQYGWWEPCEELGLPGYPLDGPRNVSYNACIDAGVTDPISSANSLRRWPCEVSREE